MNKTGKACFATAGLFAVLLTLVIALGNMRHNKIEQQPPLTVHEVEGILETAPSAEEAAPPAASAAHEQKGASPLRLERAITEEQGRKMFTEGLSGKWKVQLFLGTSPLGAVADAARVAAGHPEGESYARAMSNLLLGNWNDARLYFAEYLRSAGNDEYQQRVFAYLAWMENDPELAARYATAACSGEDWQAMIVTVELAVATGSAQLAQYAIDRGRATTNEFDLQLRRRANLESTRRWLSERQQENPEPGQ